MVNFRVVGCVASVGGLDALTRVLAPLPATFPAAVIALMHSEPDRASRLATLLGRRSQMPVVDAAHRMSLEAGRVHVAPPGCHTLVTSDGTLALVPSGEYPPYRPSADLMLVSLALAAGPLGVAVVLSGGGNDGATGATAVHALGGRVVISDAASSQAYGMPSAVMRRAGVVDQEVGVDRLGSVLAELVGAPVPARPTG